MREGAFEFYPAAPDIRQTGLHRNRGIGRDFHRRFVDYGISDPDFPGHDCALGLFPAREEPSLHEKEVEPGVFCFFSHSKRCARAADVPEPFYSDC